MRSCFFPPVQPQWCPWWPGSGCRRANRIEAAAGTARTINERNARLAASYPNPDVNDLLASVNELSQLLFEHPMHTLVQMLLANARAMSDDDSEFPPYWTRPDEGRN